MKGTYRGLIRRTLLLAAAVSLAACGGSGGGDSSPPVTSPPPPPPPPPTGNVNIDNPTLTVSDNLDVTSGDPQSWTLVWSDEFDAAQLDPEVWFFENGDGSQYGIPGWGNNELQWYLEDSAELRDGKLVITARQESAGGKSYTSARINTRDRFAFRYGRIEARIRLPAPGRRPARSISSRPSTWVGQAGTPSSAPFITAENGQTTSSRATSIR